MSRRPTPPRRRVDLRRLPVAAQYAIALVVVGVVIAVVWWTRGGHSHVAWWYWLAIFVGVLVGVVLGLWTVVRRLSRRR